MENILQIQKAERLTINKINEYPMDFLPMSVQEQMMAKGGNGIVWKAFKRALKYLGVFTTGVIAGVCANAVWDAIMKDPDYGGPCGNILNMTIGEFMESLENAQPGVVRRDPDGTLTIWINGENE